MFFTTHDNMPEGLGFQAFGPAHLCWLAAALALFISACIFHGKLSENKQKSVL